MDVAVPGGGPEHDAATDEVGDLVVGNLAVDAGDLDPVAERAVGDRETAAGEMHPILEGQSVEPHEVTADLKGRAQDRAQRALHPDRDVAAGERETPDIAIIAGCQDDRAARAGGLESCMQLGAVEHREGQPTHGAHAQEGAGGESRDAEENVAACKEHVASMGLEDNRSRRPEPPT